MSFICTVANGSVSSKQGMQGYNNFIILHCRKSVISGEEAWFLEKSDSVALNLQERVQGLQMPGVGLQLAGGVGQLEGISAPSWSLP